MTGETILAERLTRAVAATDGVITIFPTKPILHAATEGIASALDLPVADVLVDVTMADGLTTITAHIGVSADHATPQTLTDAAETLRSVAAGEGFPNTMIFVKARIISRPDPLP